VRAPQTQSEARFLSGIDTVRVGESHKTRRRSTLELPVTRPESGSNGSAASKSLENDLWPECSRPEPPLLPSPITLEINAGDRRQKARGFLSRFCACDFAALTQVAVWNDHDHPWRCRREYVSVPHRFPDISRSHIDFLLCLFG